MNFAKDATLPPELAKLPRISVGFPAPETLDTAEDLADKAAICKNNLKVLEDFIEENVLRYPRVPKVAYSSIEGRFAFIRMLLEYLGLWSPRVNVKNLLENLSATHKQYQHFYSS